MFRLITETMFQNDNNSVFILDFRNSTNRKYSEHGDKNWQKVYEKEFELTEDTFIFNPDFVTETETINFQTLLPAHSRIKKLYCQHQLEKGRYASKIILQNNEVHHHINPQHDIMLFRIGNRSLLIIPAQPNGKLLVYNIPTHIFEPNAEIYALKNKGLTFVDTHYIHNDKIDFTPLTAQFTNQPQRRVNH